MNLLLFFIIGTRFIRKILMSLDRKYTITCQLLFNTRSKFTKVIFRRPDYKHIHIKKKCQQIITVSPITEIIALVFKQYDLIHKT